MGLQVDLRLMLVLKESHPLASVLDPVVLKLGSLDLCISIWIALAFDRCIVLMCWLWYLNYYLEKSNDLKRAYQLKVIFSSD